MISILLLLFCGLVSGRASVDAFGVPRIGEGDSEYQYWCNQGRSREECAWRIFLLERQIRAELVELQSQVYDAAAKAPAYFSVMSEYGNMMNQINSYLVQGGRPARDDFPTRMTSITNGLLSLQQTTNSQNSVASANFQQATLKSNNMAPLMLQYNQNLMLNLTNAFDAVFLNQTNYDEQNLDMVQSYFAQNTTKIKNDFANFVVNLASALTLVDQNVSLWGTYQTGNISASKSKMRALDAALTSKGGQLTRNVSSKASSLRSSAIESFTGETTYQKTSFLNQLGLQKEAVDNLMTQLNINVSKSDETLRAEDTDWRTALINRVITQQGVLVNAFDGFDKNTTNLELNLTQETVASASKQQNVFSSLTAALESISNATASYQKAANQTKFMAVLQTRKVLAKLDQFLSAIKAAMAAKATSVGDVAAAQLETQADVVIGEQVDPNAVLLDEQKGSVELGQTAGENSLAMFKSVANFLLLLDKLPAVVKARAGLFAAGNAQGLGSLNGALKGASGDLSGTLQEIADADIAGQAQTASHLLGLQADTASDAADQLKNFQGNLESQMTAMDAAYSSVRTLSQRAVAGGAQTTQDLGEAAAAEAGAANDLAESVRASADVISGSYSGVDATASEMESAVAETVATAQAEIKRFITEEATRVGKEMLNGAAQINETFRPAFHALETFAEGVYDHARKSYKQIIIDANTTKNSVTGASESISELLKSTTQQKNDTVGLISALQSVAETRWTEILQQRTAELLNDAAASEFSTNDTIQKQIALFEAYAVNAMDGVLNRSLIDFTNSGQLSAEIETDLGRLNASYQSYVTDTSIAQRDADEASGSAKDQSERQVHDLAAMEADASNAVMGFNGQISSFSSSLAERNASGIAEIQKTASDVLSEANTATKELVDFTNGIISTVKDAKNQTDIEETLASKDRLLIVNSMKTEVGGLRNQLLSSVSAASAENREVLEKLTEALDSLAKAEAAISDESGLNTETLSKQLSAIRSTIGGLEASLQSNLVAAENRLAGEVAIAQLDNEAMRSEAVANQGGQAQGLGMQLLNAMDGLVDSSNTVGAEYDDQQAQVYQLEALVDSMGPAAALQLKSLLRDVTTGRTTLLEALNKSAVVNFDDFDSIAKVLEAFQGVIEKFIAQSNQFFATTAGDVQLYENSTDRLIQNYRTIQAEAMKPLVSLNKMSGAVAEGFNRIMQDELKKATEANTLNQDAADLDVEAVKAAEVDLNKEIAGAELTLQSIRDDEKVHIQSMATGAANVLKAKLRGVHSTYFQNLLQQPLGLDAVHWPTQ